MEQSRPEWRDAFYVTSWTDAQAIAKPQYKPRGEKQHGPFSTYGDADLYGQQLNCTHFSIDKVRVAPNIHPPFLDHTGNRMQEEIPFTD